MYLPPKQASKWNDSSARHQAPNVRLDFEDEEDVSGRRKKVRFLGQRGKEALLVKGETRELTAAAAESEKREKGGGGEKGYNFWKIRGGCRKKNSFHSIQWRRGRGDKKG